MHLELLTPDTKAFDGEVESVKVPGSRGTFEILHNHAAVVSTLVKGEVRILSKAKGDQVFTIDAGTVEVLDNKIVVLAESIINE
ncbi:ATP synthase F1 subunit epsilon [Sediminitomix flava]|uniref:ATP synthase F1 subcomplex epsilon subunit n=1 Tax=Sediminitomix flava TaxID=379075 RepID=A0A315Z5W8_SEDFL|nr:ATP synthase F1 subunit epsilon [Sediminitomix flava]PWJ39102.1 ATP synthase F1 subcomplex epsilon subunit [Sediminitomix flava]